MSYIDEQDDFMEIEDEDFYEIEDDEIYDLFDEEIIESYTKNTESIELNDPIVDYTLDTSFSEISDDVSNLFYIICIRLFLVTITISISLVNLGI